MIARMHNTVMKFHVADGWTIDALESCLSMGRVCQSLCKKYFFLSQIERGHFDVKKLSAIVTDIIITRGSVATPKERDVCLKYFSQVGLFEHGELAGVRR